jgi:transposase
LKNVKNKFTSLEGNGFSGITAFRTTTKDRDQNVTAVVMHDQNVYDAKILEITNTITKCKTALAKLTSKLKNQAKSEIPASRQHSESQITNDVKNILFYEHMESFFEYKVEKKDDGLSLIYNVNKKHLDFLKQCVLGKSILFTNMHNWSNEQIVGAYMAHCHVSESFRQIKHESKSSFLPSADYSKPPSEAHNFYSITAQTLASFLNLELKRGGYNVSIEKMMEELSDILLFVNYYVNGEKVTTNHTFSPMDPAYRDYFERHDLYRFAK